MFLQFIHIYSNQTNQYPNAKLHSQNYSFHWRHFPPRTAHEDPLRPSAHARICQLAEKEQSFNHIHRQIYEGKKKKNPRDEPLSLERASRTQDPRRSIHPRSVQEAQAYPYD